MVLYTIILIRQFLPGFWKVLSVLPWSCFSTFVAVEGPIRSDATNVKKVLCNIEKYPNRLDSLVDLENSQLTEEDYDRRLRSLEKKV